MSARGGNNEKMRKGRSHEDLVDVLRRRVAFVVVHDRLSRDAGDGGDNVVLRHSLRNTLLDEVVRQAVAEDLAAGPAGGSDSSAVAGEAWASAKNARLGRVELEVRPGEKLVNHSLVDRAPLAHGAVLVVLGGAVREVSLSVASDQPSHSKFGKEKRTAHMRP